MLTRTISPALRIQQLFIVTELITLPFDFMKNNKNAQKNKNQEKLIVAVSPTCLYTIIAMPKLKLEMKRCQRCVLLYV